jgi:CRP-like cAMP-binding protein
MNKLESAGLSNFHIILEQCEIMKKALSEYNYPLSVTNQELMQKTGLTQFDVVHVLARLRLLNCVNWVFKSDRYLISDVSLI